MAIRRKVTVSLPPHVDDELKQAARRDFGGNVSAAIQWALAQSGVTKSAAVSPVEATRTT